MNKHGEIVSREEYERRSKRRARPSTACHRKISQSKSPNVRVRDFLFSSTHC